MDTDTLLRAACGGHVLELIHLLTRMGPDVNYFRYTRGDRLLHRAAFAGEGAVVMVLLGRGADVNAANMDGSTALHFSASAGHRRVAELLLEHGAAVDAKDNAGTTALHGAAEEGLLAVVELLLEHGADVDAKDIRGYTVLVWATQFGRLAVVELLLEHGAAVDAKDNDGWTALIWAAQNGHLAVAQQLLEKGADVDAKDNDGFTALYVGALESHLEIVELLLEHGADVDAKDNAGRTALHTAVHLDDLDGGHLPVVELLLQKGADVNAKNNDGFTVLHWATKERHVEAAELLLLLAQRVDVNVSADKDGRTALHYAAEQGLRNLVDMLTERGAFVNTRDNDGWTALALAARDGHIDTAFLLLDRGAVADFANRDRLTAIDMAATPRVGRSDSVLLSRMLRSCAALPTIARRALDADSGRRRAYDRALTYAAPGTSLFSDLLAMIGELSAAAGAQDTDAAGSLLKTRMNQFNTFVEGSLRQPRGDARAQVLDPELRADVAAVLSGLDTVACAPYPREAIDRKITMVTDKDQNEYWRCKICSKMFKGEDFVVKHVRNKHTEWPLDRWKGRLKLLLEGLQRTALIGSLGTLALDEAPPSKRKRLA